MQPTFTTVENCRWLAAHGAVQDTDARMYYAADGDMACSCECVPSAVAALTPLQALDELVRLGVIGGYMVTDHFSMSWEPGRHGPTFLDDEPGPRTADALVTAIIAAQEVHE
jgi:hypothetical protein